MLKKLFNMKKKEEIVEDINKSVKELADIKDEDKTLQSYIEPMMEFVMGDKSLQKLINFIYEYIPNSTLKIGNDYITTKSDYIYEIRVEKKKRFKQLF